MPARGPTSNLFTYGSLMFDEVWIRLVRQSVDSRPAVLTGFRRRAVAGEAYPALVPDGRAQVEGRLYLGLEPRTVALLDHFEGSDYRRITVQVTGNDRRVYGAYTYLFAARQRHRVLPKDWDVDWFARSRLSGFLAGYPGFRRGS